jgi:hypothetical protein
VRREHDMTRQLLAVGALAIGLLAGRAQASSLPGSWTASVSSRDAGVLNVSLRTHKNENGGNRFERSDFTGLTAEQVRSTTQVPVHFELRHEAGTITFDGLFRSGEGAGTFTFDPNEDFPAQLKKLGVAFDPKDMDTDNELLTLTSFDVSTAFIRSMRDIGYDVPLEKYVEFRIFGVNPAYVREMRSVGFGNLSADKLVETKIHGATPDYIRDMRAKGEDLSLDKYIESRIFEITPEFTAEMARAGYPNLSRDLLVQCKIQGVTPEFIQELKKLGYTHLSASKLVEMRIHGVTPEFIRQLSAAGYSNVPVDKMIQMRIFDIKPEMVRALDDANRREVD